MHHVDSDDRFLGVGCPSRDPATFRVTLGQMDKSCNAAWSPLEANLGQTRLICFVCRAGRDSRMLEADSNLPHVRSQMVISVGLPF